MAETIETFVAKLQEEGVQAGRHEADRIRDEAEKQAKDIVDQARRQAAEIVADAKTQAEDNLARSRTEMALAARDAVLRLQEVLGRALSAVLTQQTRAKLTDDDFLGKLLHELVMTYVNNDFQCKEVLRINVAPEMREKLISWALKEIGEESVQHVRLSIDLKGTLSDAGFEYTCSGSTVEVTAESVVEALMGLVGPALRELIGEAMAEGKE